MKDKARNALIEMGMSASLSGFRYIVDAVCLLDSEEWCNCKTTALYRKIADMNKTSDIRVERAIRHAFGVVLRKGQHESVNKYLTRQKTTNGNLLHVLHLRLTQEE